MLVWEEEARTPSKNHVFGTASNENAYWTLSAAWQDFASRHTKHKPHGFHALRHEVVAHGPRTPRRLKPGTLAVSLPMVRASF